MASSKEFVQFVCEQVYGFGSVRARHMFGDYLVYIDDRPVMNLCDNTVFVKMLPELTPFLSGAETGEPYPTAKLHYILDVENRELLEQVVPILVECIPVPVKKRKKVSAALIPEERGE